MQHVKLLLLGDESYVGYGRTKVQFLFAFATGSVPEEYIPTTFDTYNSIIKVDNQEVNIGIWDVICYENYDRLRPLSYPDTSIFMLNYDISDRVSFLRVKKWYEEAKAHCPYASFFLLGLAKEKRDDPETRAKILSQNPNTKFVSKEAADWMAQQLKLESSFQVETRSITDIKEAVMTSVRKCLKSKVKHKKPGLIASLFGSKQAKDDNLMEEVAASKTKLSIEPFLSLLLTKSSVSIQNARIIHPNVVITMEKSRYQTHITTVLPQQDAVNVIWDAYELFQSEVPITYQEIDEPKFAQSSTTTESKKPKLRVFHTLPTFYPMRMDDLICNLRKSVKDFEKKFFLSHSMLLGWISDFANRKLPLKTRTVRSVLGNVLVCKAAKQLTSPSIPMDIAFVGVLSERDCGKILYELMTLDINSSNPNWNHERLGRYNTLLVSSAKSLFDGKLELRKFPNKIVELPEDFAPSADLLEAIANELNGLEAKTTLYPLLPHFGSLTDVTIEAWDVPW